jgi:hypothetical protein
MNVFGSVKHFIIPVELELARPREISGSHGGKHGDNISLVMEAVSTSETSISFCKTTRRNIREDGNLCTSLGVKFRHIDIFTSANYRKACQIMSELCY